MKEEKIMASHSLYVVNMLLQAKEEIDKYRDKLKENINLLNHIQNFINNYFDIVFWAQECETCFDHTSLGRVGRAFERIRSLLTIVKNKNDDDTSDEYLDYIDYLENLSEALEGASRLYYYGIKPGSNEFVYGNYDNNVIYNIAEHIVSLVDHNTNINLLDMEYCNQTIGCRLNLEKINNYVWRDTINYYSEMSHYSYKFIGGMFSTCKISNGVFDIVFSMPEYTIQSYSVQNKNQYTNKKERQYLVNSLKYLKPNGLLLYVIKKYRLTKDIASVIAKYLCDVKIIECSTDNVMIVGNRRKDREPDQELYARLRQIYKNDFVYDEYYNYIPEISKTSFQIDAFKGSLYHDDMLKETITTGNLLNNFIESLSNIEEEHQTRRPLLPFSVGQLGLVLTSGCLDGIVEEPDIDGTGKHYHVIKGSVTKKKDKSTIAGENGSSTTEEVVSSKVNINIIKPNGDLLTLA